MNPIASSRVRTRPRVRTGLECCLEDLPPVLRGARIGLLYHQASVDGNLRDAAAGFAALEPHLELACLFSPQHGIWGEEQANMIETPHGRDERLGIPRHSLYSETRRPSPQMLAPLDCLVVDLQDVGTRVYTYAWTLVHTMQACADASLPVVVLDRPNPLGGTVVEGPRLQEDYTSFVGMAPIPMRHALTLGELARYCNAFLEIGCELHVVPMEGWHREMLFPETQLPWIPPSPNMPRFETAVAYPGQVLLEGTNLSEGRGTTLPFESIGAPFVDPYELRTALPDAEDRFGVQLRPIYYRPTFDKWQGDRCGGLAWHWQDAASVRSYALTVHLLAAIWRRWPDHFRWLPPPYEYEYVKPPIDILSGDARLREWQRAASAGAESSSLDELVIANEAGWWSDVRPFLLY